MRRFLVEEARVSVDEAIAHAVQSEEDVSSWESVGVVLDMASEYADGHQRVIYYHLVRELFHHGDLDAYLDDVREARGEPYESVDDWLAGAAYLALMEAYHLAWIEAMTDRDLGGVA
jgi:hypothetical protein